MRFNMNRNFTDNQNAIVHEKLLHMLVQSLQPLSFVESEGFQGLMKFLEPVYTLPDKKLLQDMLLNMYEAGKVKLMSTLAEDAPHYSVVYDLWRNNDQECYMTVIIHYLNDQWERKSWVLGTEQLSQLRATGNEIGNCISSLLLMYNLPLQGLVGTVYRQGMLKSQMGRIGTLLACESMSCAAEKLDMCVQAAFAIPEIRDVIDKAGKLANYLIHDDGARRILQEMKEVDGFTHQVELAQDHKGSWVATCNMLMKLIALKEEIEKVSDQDIKNKQLYLSEEKWALIELLMNSLQILKAALTVMSEDKTGSVSCLLPVVHSILQHCEDSSHAKNSPMDNFLKTIGKETREKWDLTAILPSSIPMLAALLDPRFKKLKFIAEEDKGDVFDALKGVLGTIKVAGTDGTTNSNSQDLSPFLCLFGGTEEYTQERQDTDSEITNYTNFPMLRHECCPLDWWRVNQGRFPELAKLARQYLSVPAIALPVKEIKAGAWQLDMKRGLLEVEAAGPLIFMNHNWALY
ncbi:E3 SUMO-protein ligase ZBED1-like [Diadema antillarum]|uniref:E3 SUMO-protein ligase ZBED1-like n=1 Tax=Diadema antillarum TaxID=105358 RepID=UPI003A871D8E